MARKETDRAFNERMVREFPGNFRIDDTVLFCIKCNCPVPSKKLSSVKAHLETKKHTDAEELREKNQGRAQTQTLLTEHQKPQTINPFNMDLCRTFLEANIPLKKITHPSVIEFIQKYTNNTLPSETTLRQKYVPILYNKCIEDLRAKVGNKYIWVSIDETTDCENRLVANFIFGLMEGVDDNSPEKGKCYLLNMAVVKAANASEMAAFFNDSLLILWPDGKVLIVKKVFFTFFTRFFTNIYFHILN